MKFARVMIVCSCLCLIMLPGCRKKEVVNQPNDSATAVAIPDPLPEVPLDSAVKDSIDLLINNYFGNFSDNRKAGMAIGILVDGAVAYTRCLGTTRNDNSGSPITRQTKFNIHPTGPFKSPETFSLFSNEGFKKANVQLSSTPDESVAYPHALSLHSPNDEDGFDLKALPLKAVDKKGVMWASLDETMRYLVANPNDGLEKCDPELFKQETLCNELSGTGYRVVVASVPSKKLQIVLMENSYNSVYIMDFFEHAINILVPVEIQEKASDDDENSDSEEVEDMFPRQRRIYYALDGNDKQKLEGLIAKYHCDNGYSDFQIVLENNSFILKTENWESRIAAYDTYDADFVSVSDDGRIEVEDAVTGYRLLDAPVADLRITPEFDDKNIAKSVAIGHEFNQYEKIGELDMLFRYKEIENFTTCNRVE